MPKREVDIDKKEIYKPTLVGRVVIFVGDIIKKILNMSDDERDKRADKQLED